MFECVCRSARHAQLARTEQNSSSSSKSHRVVEEGRVFRRLHRFHRPGCYCSEQLRAHSLLTEDSRGLVHSGPLGAARAVWTTLLKMKSVPKSQSLRLSNELTSEFWVKVGGGTRCDGFRSISLHFVSTTHSSVWVCT